MSTKLALFFCISLLFTTSFVEMRMIPGRSQMSSPQSFFTRHSKFPRHLEDDNANTQTNTNTEPMEPVTLRLRGDTELGYYYVTLFFGIPLQKQTLIVDTGSSTTTIPCQECEDNCGKNHFDRPFNHEQSETFEKFKCQESFGDYTCNDCSSIECGFGVSYVEGSSYRGHFTRDYVTFGNELDDYFHLLNPEEPEQLEKDQDEGKRKAQQDILQDIINQRKTFAPFGCTDRETKLFYDQQADGIFGLGINTNSRNSPPNLIDAMGLKNSKFDTTFSLCLAPSGGYFTLGGYNKAYHHPNEMVHTARYFEETGQYRVTLNKIEIEGQDLGLTMSTLNDGYGVFFDSGTTLTHMPSKSYNAVRSHITSFCAEKDGNCGNNANTKKEPFCWTRDRTAFPDVKDFFNSFPTFTFSFGQLGDAKYEWKGEDYLYNEQDGDKYCLGLAKYERETILGGTFMKNHDIMFDKKHKRVGFARANCAALNEAIPLIGPDGEKFMPEPNVVPEPEVQETQKEPSETQKEPSEPTDATPDNKEGTSAEEEEDNGDGTTTFATPRNINWDQVKTAGIVLGVVLFIGSVTYAIVKKRKNKNYFKDIQQDVELPSAKALGTSFEASLPDDKKEKKRDEIALNTGSSSSSSDIGVAI